MTDKDGWHIVYGKNVYVENGKVVFGTTKGENDSEVTCYPYEYNKDLDCWVNISGEVTLSAYRAGYKRGTKCMK
jgi:ORF55